MAATLSPAPAFLQSPSPAATKLRPALVETQLRTYEVQSAAGKACLIGVLVPGTLRLTRKHFRRAQRGLRIQRLATGAPDVPVERERYTDAAWQAMQDAPEIASKSQSQYVETEHVFLACLEQPISTTGGLCARILEKLGIKKQAASDRVLDPWISISLEDLEGHVISMLFKSVQWCLTKNVRSCHFCLKILKLCLRNGAANSPRLVGVLGIGVS